jgi:tetratricopeptide (TPR) repeat protein
MEPPSTEGIAETTSRSSWWGILVIIAAAIAGYHNSFNGPFVFDDHSSIVTNPSVRKLWPLSAPLTPPSTNVTAQGRPILNLSLAINYALGESAVQGYHIGNLILHTLSGLTLFGLVRRTLQLRAASHAATAGPGYRLTSEEFSTRGGLPLHWIALAIAVLWTIHPLQTESVTYIIQRAESLMGLFYLLTLYCFVRGVGMDIERLSAGSQHCGAWLVLSVLACLAGMATKEVMATAPLMVLFFDRTFCAGTFGAALRRRRGFYLALASTWLLLAWLVAQTGGNRGGSVGFGVGIGWIDYALTQFKAVAHYLWLSVWPQPLVFEYGSFWIRNFSEIAVQVALVFGLLAATVVALWRRSAVGFLGAWFFGVLAPTSLAPGTTQMIVEHRMYLPLAAVIALAVGALHGALGRRQRSLAGWVLGGAAVALLLLTVRRNEDYRSDIALWTDTIAKRPNNPLAHFMLAGAQERAGNLQAAVKHYEQTLELKPDFSIGHENFGELLLRQGRRADAIAHFESALRLQPEYPDAHANLGNAYLAENLITEALGHLEKAAQLMPASAITRYNLGNALSAARLPDEAVVQYEAALKLDPSMAEAHFNLANALMELRRTADAIVHFEAAVQKRPGFAAAHYNLANALAASGRKQDAVTQYEAALQARPDYPEAHHNLASALFELGRLPEAARHYEETLRLAPEFPNARENLERVRARMNSK